MHQVRLAEADAAVEEQRIEGHDAAFGDTARSRVREFIGLADDEAFEGEARIERRAREIGVVPGRSRGGLRGVRAVPGRLDVGLRLDLGRNRTGLCGALGRDMERDAVHLVAGFQEHTVNLLAEVSRHPCSHEVSRHQERGDAIVQIREFERFDPVYVVVPAYRGLQLFPDLAPKLVCHFPSTYRFLSRTGRRPCHCSGPLWRRIAMCRRRENPIAAIRHKCRTDGNDRSSGPLSAPEETKDVARPVHATPLIPSATTRGPVDMAERAFGA